MLYEWFVKPIIEGIGYNVFNTAVYAVLLLASIFLVAKLLKRMKVKTDRRLWNSVVPFVILAGVLRALQDHDFFTSLGVMQYLFVTPLIYLTVFFLALLSIFISKKTKTNSVFFFGWLMVFIFSVFVVLKTVSFFPLITAAVLTVIIFCFTWFFIRLIGSRLLKSLENKFVLFGQALDSCSSTIAILVIGGFSEQHVLPKELFSFIPFYFFIPLKITITLLALYAIDKEVKDSRIAWVLKLAIFAVGAGPGTRNALTMIMN